MKDSFSKSLLKWFDQFGRKNLPWQQNITPYRVWVSEIMLQQTQVKTVIPYFLRFMERFPDVYSLASASIDTVLEHWAGLGYYARARNLHRCAQMIVQAFNGEFPDNLEDLQKLPGIGRSTAGAILGIAFQKHAVILDGNVKRVLSRYHAISDPIYDAKALEKMWELASAHTPHERTRDYTQAIMDLGATLCTRTRPQCQLCPFIQTCAAYHLSQPTAFPVTKKKTAIPNRQSFMLILQHGDEILLQKRPPTGIWGGLLSLPEAETKEAIKTWTEKHLGIQLTQLRTLSPMKHTFTHFHLSITPILAHFKRQYPAPELQCMETPDLAWYPFSHYSRLGLPAPIKRILKQLHSDPLYDNTYDLLPETETGN